MDDPQASLDRLSLSAPAPPPEAPWSARERVWLGASLGVSLVSLVVLAALSARIDRAWARPLVYLSVLGASLGPAGIALLSIAPRRSALRLRHFVAGIVAAWACIALAGAARRMGIPADSGGFRALWAPIAEELTKAAMLALMMTSQDRDGDRRAIATAGVAVGAGFAFRENVVYFATAVNGDALPIEWLVLRAFPPVFAHTLFGATYGTILAQSAIHARALELHAPRGSAVALLLATLAHCTYNAVPWAVLSQAPQVAIPFAIGWALLALVATWAISRRVRAMSHDDPPLSERVSIVLASRTSVDRAALVFAAVIAMFWVIPLAIPRYLAVVFSPAALGALIVLGLASALRVERAIAWVLLGIAARPLFSMSEAALSALPLAWRSPVAGRLASVVGALLWALAAVALGRRVGRDRAPSVALVAGAAFAAGLIAASIGGNLAAGVGFAPWRALVGALFLHLPRTLVCAALLAWLGAARRALAPLAAIGVAIAAVALDYAIGRWQFRAAIPSAIALFAALALLVSIARRAPDERSSDGALA